MNVKSLFRNIYQRCTSLNATQLCLLFCGAAFVLAAMVLYERPYQRFIPFPATNDRVVTTLALDTKTGQICSTLSRSMLSDYPTWHPAKGRLSPDDQERLINDLNDPNVRSLELVSDQGIQSCKDLYK